MDVVDCSDSEEPPSKTRRLCANINSTPCNANQNLPPQTQLQLQLNNNPNHKNLSNNNNSKINSNNNANNASNHSNSSGAGSVGRTTPPQSPSSDAEGERLTPEPAPKAPKIVGSCNCDDLKPVQCHLETKELWDRFHELGTEMIITKTGR